MADNTASSPPSTAPSAPPPSKPDPVSPEAHKRIALEQIDSVQKILTDLEKGTHHPLAGIAVSGLKPDKDDPASTLITQAGRHAIEDVGLGDIGKHLREAGVKYAELAKQVRQNGDADGAIYTHMREVFGVLNHMGDQLQNDHMQQVMADFITDKQMRAVVSEVDPHLAASMMAHIAVEAGTSSRKAPNTEKDLHKAADEVMDAYFKDASPQIREEANKDADKLIHDAVVQKPRPPGGRGR